MDKKKLAFVWKKEKQANKPQIKTHEKESIPTFTSTDKISKRKPRDVQKSFDFRAVFTAGISAVIIGTIMGMIMINLFTNITEVGEPEDSTTVTSTLPDQEDAQTKGGKDSEDKEGQAELDGMNAYVLQAGVFSNQENADESAKDYEKAGFITEIWERDEQYYLLAGIAETKERGIEVAKELDHHELDIYIKEWDTKKSQVKLNKNDGQWIKSFEKQWESTLSLLEEDKKIPVEDWDSLTKDQQSKSENVQAVEETISVFLKDGVTEFSVQEAEHLLIKSWKQYEEIK